MRNRTLYVAAVLAVMTCRMFAQQPPAKPQPESSTPPATAEKTTFAAAPEALTKLLESQVKAEWEAIKKRDKEAYSKLLTEDFIIVESDGDGARNRYKAANELAASFVTDYRLQLLKTYSLAPDVTYVRYECTMEFPAKSALRFKRMWISEIWVRTGKDWKLWRYQETSVR